MLAYTDNFVNSRQVYMGIRCSLIGWTCTMQSRYCIRLRICTLVCSVYTKISVYQQAVWNHSNATSNKRLQYLKSWSLPKYKNFTPKYIYVNVSTVLKFDNNSQHSSKWKNFNGIPIRSQIKSKSTRQKKFKVRPVSAHQSSRILLNT